MPFGDGKVYTSNSSPSPYLTYTELTYFVDPQLLADVLAAPASPGGPPVAPDVSTLASNAFVRAWMMGASGRLESAAVAGKRYTPESLAAMDGVGRMNMCRIVAYLVAFEAYSRRDGQHPPENVVYRYQEAEKELERLRDGEEVFSFQETQGAGLPDSRKLTEADLLSQNLVSSQWTRFFGTRQNLLRGWW